MIRIQKKKNRFKSDFMVHFEITVNLNIYSLATLLGKLFQLLVNANV